MKTAFTLFVGMFASGLALASLVEPSTNKISCRTFYSFVSDRHETIRVEGPSLTDGDTDAIHHENFYDENWNIEFSYHWDEASDFRPLTANVKVYVYDRLKIEKTSIGKPHTAIHLTDLELKPLAETSIKVSRENGFERVRIKKLDSLSFHCGIEPQF